MWHIWLMDVIEALKDMTVSKMVAYVFIFFYVLLKKRFTYISDGMRVNKWTAFNFFIFGWNVSLISQTA